MRGKAGRAGRGLQEEKVGRGEKGRSEAGKGRDGKASGG